MSAQESASLQSELASVRAQIGAAEAEDAKLVGGLVKSLIAVRLATLKQTEAMLQQKAKASAFGISLKYTASGIPFSPPPSSTDILRSVEAEIAENAIKIREQEADLARYSGGLVMAISASTLATQRQTQAMLEQKRLALKFGLPQYIGFADAQVAPKTSSNSASKTEIRPPENDELHRSLTFAVGEKGFVPADTDLRRYQAVITINCTYSNNSEKDIRAFTGVIVFEDLFGKEIYKSSLTISDPVRAGQHATWMGSINFNQFNEQQARLRNAKLEDMKVVWQPASRMR